MLSQGGVEFTGVTIQNIRGGQIVFLDQAGRTQRRGAMEIRAIRFDDQPRLDEAETRFAAGQYAAARDRLLMSMVDASSDMQRLWVHVRLARVHDRMNEYVEAAGHAAAVFELDDDPAWATLEPVCDPAKREGPVTFAAAAESRDNLRQAQRAVRTAALTLALQRMERIVQPVHAELEATFTGDAPPPGSTISGVSRDDIIAMAERERGDGDDRGDRDEVSAGSTAPIDARENAPRAADDDAPKSPLSAAPGAKPPMEAAALPDDVNKQTSSPTPAKGAKPTVPVHEPDPMAEPFDSRSAPPAAPPAATVVIDDRPADEIDALLAGGQFASALEQCEAAAGNPGSRDLARFLHQYGRALKARGHTQRALVMFSRCAVLYEGSPFASQSLIETAMLYRDALNQPRTARRLLERVVERATAHRHSSALSQAQGLLRSFQQAG